MTAVPRDLPVPIRAALLMLGSTAFFAMMVIAIRLASESLHTFEVAFFRNLFGLVAALPLLLRHGPGLLRTTQFPRYIFRCLIGVCSMIAGFWAIGHLPLAQAISLSYSTPLFATIAAAALLGEQVRVRRWAAVALGFAGVLLIVRPGTTGFSTGTMIALLAALLSSLVAIQIKQLSATEPADRIVLYTTLLWVPMSLLPALSVWQWPQGIVWLWLAAAGIAGTAILVWVLATFTDSQVVLAEARSRLDRYIAESHRLGRDVTRSGLFAALHAEGVQRVEISSPAADVVVDRTQATYCTAVTLTHGGNDE